jgi:hypothetical protein
MTPGTDGGILSTAALADASSIVPADAGRSTAADASQTLMSTDAADASDRQADDVEQSFVSDAGAYFAQQLPDLTEEERAAMTTGFTSGLGSASGSLSQVSWPDPVAGTHLLPPRISQVLAMRDPSSQASPDALLSLLKAVQLDPAVVIPPWLGLTRNDPDTQQRLLTVASADDSDAGTQQALGVLNKIFGPSGTAPSSADGSTSDVLLAAGLPANLVSWLPTAYSLAKDWFAKTTSGGNRGGPPSTRPAGEIAHAIIQADYLAAHLNNLVIFDDRGTTPGANSLRQWILQKASGLPAYTQVLQWLTSAVTGLAGEPDILDLTTYEVYEIKPIRQFYNGFAQLYGRYLLRLNIGALGAAAAKTLLQSFDASGQPGPNFSSPARFYAPGVLWQPKPWYPVGPNLSIIAFRVIPGLILYEYTTGKQQSLQTQADLSKALEATSNYLARAAVAAAAVQAIYPAGPTTDVATALAWSAGIDADEFRDELLTLSGRAAVSVGILIAALLFFCATATEGACLAPVFTLA